MRYDPNGALPFDDAVHFGQAIEDLRNDYFEDPVYGIAPMKALRDFVRIPLATNTVVVNFEQLAANAATRAVDVILLDTTFWGGIRPCIKAAGVCETLGMQVAVHSSGELGIQLATMLHLGAVLPNLGYAADAHYHHLVDDVIVGGPMRYEGGAIRVPDGPGLGVTLDRDKLAATTSSSARRAATLTIGIPAAPAGSRTCRTARGRTPRTRACPRWLNDDRSDDAP
jgi:glucarate dehydratase